MLTNALLSPAGMNMSMPKAMAMAMASMCRTPARRDVSDSGGG